MAQKKAKTKTAGKKAPRKAGKKAPRKAGKKAAKRRGKPDDTKPKQEKAVTVTTAAVPGLSYARRIGTTYLSALTRQTVDVEKAWNRMKDGSITLKDLGGAIASSVEGYYATALELAKGPSYQRRPEYLHFAYNRREENTATATVQIDPLPAGATIEGSDFTSLAGKKALAGTQRGGRNGVYDQLLLSQDRSFVEIRLDEKILHSATPGHYTGIITAKSGGGLPPLVIVTLSIE